MPCGSQLIEAVAAQLHVQNGITPSEIQRRLEIIKWDETSRRAIRYAIAELIKQGRAKRKGQQGPVYAITQKEKSC